MAAMRRILLRSRPPGRSKAAAASRSGTLPVVSVHEADDRRVPRLDRLREEDAIRFPVPFDQLRRRGADEVAREQAGFGLEPGVVRHVRTKA